MTPVLLPHRKANAGLRANICLLGVCLCFAGACGPTSSITWRPQAAPKVAPPTPPTPGPFDPADPPITLVRTPHSERSPAHPPRSLNVVLTVLHVQVPRAARAQVQSLWNHLREDVLDSATMLRLHRNGLRVGIGHGQWWDAIKTTLDALDGVRSISLAPVRLPPNYPLALELDQKPREQTLFYMADDGVLTGETWPGSRNVLRLNYAMNLERPEQVHLTIVPEVRQRLDGFRWIRSEAGLTQVPNYNGRAFSAASFAVDLEPEEFLLVAPGQQADLYGLVGGVFLGSELEGRGYDSYVFLRADVNHVAYRD